LSAFHHQGDEAGTIKITAHEMSDQVAVPQDRYAVGDPHHFTQAMGDIDDGLSGIAEGLEPLKQVFGIGFR
jgi:hypothetical protein